MSGSPAIVSMIATEILQNVDVDLRVIEAGEVTHLVSDGVGELRIRDKTVCEAPFSHAPFSVIIAPVMCPVVALVAQMLVKPITSESTPRAVIRLPSASKTTGFCCADLQLPEMALNWAADVTSAPLTYPPAARMVPA